MTYSINHKRTGCELLKYGEEGECTLIGAELTNTDLRGADLRGANLRGANLTGANLVGADLTGADLTHGADLTDSDLSGATLSGANLTKANLRQVWVCVGTRLHHQPNIIDLGADNRGYRFWAWHDTKFGKVVYRAGCREWFSHESAIAHYDNDKYAGTGDRKECIHRMHVIRGWAMQWKYK